MMGEVFSEGMPPASTARAGQLAGGAPSALSIPGAAAGSPAPTLWRAAWGHVVYAARRAALALANLGRGIFAYGRATAGPAPITGQRSKPNGPHITALVAERERLIRLRQHKARQHKATCSVDRDLRAATHAILRGR